MRLASLSYTTDRRGVSHRTYHVHIIHTTWWKHLVRSAYHFYDMRIPCKLPGWTRIEQFLKRHGAEYRFDGEGEKVRLRDKVLRWTVSQDIRCYNLTEWAEDIVEILNISEEQYNSIKEAS